MTGLTCAEDVVLQLYHADDSLLGQLGVDLGEVALHHVVQLCCHLHASGATANNHKAQEFAHLLQQSSKVIDCQSARCKRLQLMHLLQRSGASMLSYSQEHEHGSQGPRCPSKERPSL